MKLFYLIGEPGAGKTTLMRAIKDECAYGHPFAKPFAHVVYHGKSGNTAASLGPERGTFSGTDGLSMSVQPKVLEWLEMPPVAHIFGEGDRLANGKFFTAVTAMGYDLTVAVLETPSETLEVRRATRGSNQDPKWLEGRRTKVRRLAEDWGTLTLDGILPTADLVTYLRTHTPVFHHLLGGLK